MFPCLPSPLCSIALCGLLLLKLHRVRSCVVGFGSWDTDNTWIIGSDVFIIHSERVNIWCEFLDVSELICKLRAASFHWLQWQPGLRLRLPFLERVLQWSIMSTGIGNGSCMCDEGQGPMESSSHRFLSKGRGEWVFLDPLCVLCRISAWLWGQMFLDCWAQTQGGGCVNKRVSAVTVLMQCLVGLHGLSGKQAALAWHSGYVSPKCQTDVVMLLARLSLACWELPWVSAQPHTADTYPGDIDRFQQPCPCMVQRRNQPHHCHGTWLGLHRGAEARTSDLVSLWSCVLEKYICIWWIRIWGQHILPSTLLPAFLSSQAECCRFCSDSLQVSVWHSVFFLFPGASLSLQTDAGLAAPLPLHPGACKVQRGGSFQERRCAQSAAAELSYQELELIGIKCWTQVHLKSWECFTKLYAYDSINQLAPGQPLQLYIKVMCAWQRAGGSWEVSL